MMRFIIIFFTFFFTSFLLPDEKKVINEYEYIMRFNGIRNIIKEHHYSKDHFFRNYIIEGTIEDNFGNYGSADTVVFAIYKDNKIIKLEWSNKITYQNGKEIFFTGFRKKGIASAGVGNSILFEADKTLKLLIGTKCTYAIKFFENKTFTKSKCKINKEKKKLIENLS